MRRSWQRHTQVLLLPVRRDLDPTEIITGQKRPTAATHASRAVAIRDDRFQTSTIGGAYVDDDILAHPQNPPLAQRLSPFGFFRQVLATRRIGERTGQKFKHDLVRLAFPGLAVHNQPTQQKRAQFYAVAALVCEDRGRCRVNSYRSSFQRDSCSR